MKIKKHFVDFYSPGTFVAETSRRSIDSWDVEKAFEMAHGITQRYNATPYGFRFLTCGRNDEDLNSKEIASSPMYYLGGKVQTLAQIKSKKNPSDKILISNMECNGYDRVITNDNSWRWTQPLEKNDVALDFKPRKKKSATA